MNTDSQSEIRNPISQILWEAVVWGYVVLAVLALAVGPWEPGPLPVERIEVFFMPGEPAHNNNLYGDVR